MPNAIDHGIGHPVGIGAEQPQERHHDEIRAILPRIDGGERRLDDAVEAFLVVVTGFHHRDEAPDAVGAEAGAIFQRLPLAGGKRRL